MNNVSWILVERKFRVDPWRDTRVLPALNLWRWGGWVLFGLWIPQGTVTGFLGTVKVPFRSFP